jgi:hypothetical protein
MKLKELDIISNVNDGHALMEFDPYAADSARPRKILFSTIKAWILSLLPTSLKNPQPLSFTGGATGNYDGSAPKTVNIPTIPATRPNPSKLTLYDPIWGDEHEYDGNQAIYVEFIGPHSLPISLKSPYPVVFTGAGGGVRYDGGATREVNIPFPLGISAPTKVELTYTASVSIRNGALQRILAQLLPAFNLQDAVIFQLASGDAIDLYPDGAFKAKKLGTSKVYAIPTLNSKAYKEASITVRPALVRRTGSGAFRRAGGGVARIF